MKTCLPLLGLLVLASPHQDPEFTQISCAEQGAGSADDTCLTDDPAFVIDFSNPLAPQIKLRQTSSSESDSVALPVGPGK